MEIIFTDWEGPWTLTDFALELSMAAFNNDRFFKKLSLYDDYLAYCVKKPGYEAGYTMKLLAPFIAAAGFGNEDVTKIAEMTATFVPDAKPAMKRLKKTAIPVVISTSYVHYLNVTAKMLGIEKNLYGSFVDFDTLDVSSYKDELLKSVDVIASLEGEELYSYLDRLFSKLEHVLDDIKAVGAGEKAKIVKEYCENFKIESPIVIGDSISDYKMFELAREKGGVAIAFNGNEYALKHADIAIVSETALAEVVCVEVVLKGGIEALKRLEDYIPSEILKELSNKSFEIFLIEECDFEEVLRKSKKMRVFLRGVAGELG